jgi:hypothetical protein
MYLKKNITNKFHFGACCLWDSVSYDNHKGYIDCKLVKLSPFPFVTPFVNPLSMSSAWNFVTNFRLMIQSLDVSKILLKSLQLGLQKFYCIQFLNESMVHSMLMWTKNWKWFVCITPAFTGCFQHMLNCVPFSYIP